MGEIGFGEHRLGFPEGGDLEDLHPVPLSFEIAVLIWGFLHPSSNPPIHPFRGHTHLFGLSPEFLVGEHLGELPCGDEPLPEFLVCDVCCPLWGGITSIPIKNLTEVLTTTLYGISQTFQEEVQQDLTTNLLEQLVLSLIHI